MTPHSTTTSTLAEDYLLKQEASKHLWESTTNSKPKK